MEKSDVLITMSTPVYDSVRVAAAEGIPATTGYPPHHPDIYGQLCAEFGLDPRGGDDIDHTWALHSRPQRPNGPYHLPPQHPADLVKGERALMPCPGGKDNCRSPNRRAALCTHCTEARALASRDGCRGPRRNPPGTGPRTTSMRLLGERHPRSPGVWEPRPGATA
jgi:hypothetical protein